MLHVSPRPLAEWLDGFQSGAPELRQLVIHARRNCRQLCSLHQAVPLQSTKREGEHSLRNAADHAFDLVEALRTIAQQHDDQDAPFVADACQYRADGAAILACAIRNLDSHLCVLQYQLCAFLRALPAVPNLVQVTVLYHLYASWTRVPVQPGGSLGRRTNVGPWSAPPARSER